MREISQFHLLTFVTKYSRLPSEEIALLRYNAMMEIGKKPLVLDFVSSELIWNAFNGQAQKLWIKIIIGNVLPDHVHIIIDSNNKNISKIVNLLKWYSAHLYNHTFQHNGPIWADWYSDTYLDNETHLENAIEYVKNNHFKHQSQLQYVWWETI